MPQRYAWLCSTSKRPDCSTARQRFAHSQRCQSSSAPSQAYGPGEVTTTSPSACEPAVPNTVTSWPSFVSSRVSSQINDSTLPPDCGPTGAESVAIWAIRMGGYRKAPSTKIQAPEKLQAPSSKTSRARHDFDVWCLMFLWSLVLEIWSFIF